MPELSERVDLPHELVGSRIRIRPYRGGDGAAVFEAVDESREHILPWLPWGPLHVSEQDSEAFALRCAASWETRDDLGVGFFDVNTGRYLGGSGLHRIRWDVPAFEIGYWVRRSESGKGYVSDAVKLLTTLAFDQLDAARVFIRCAVENTRSGAIPRRLGFQHEGVLRNEIRDALGNLHDADLFSLIPSDWERLRPSFTEN